VTERKCHGSDHFSTPRAAARLLVLLLVAFGAACASDKQQLPVGLDLSPGHEEPPWHSEPPPGLVHLRFDVDPNGRVTDIVIVESYPPGVFDDQAIASIKRRRYEPNIVDGVPVGRTGIEVLVQFDEPVESDE
jgi:TonB family protein